MGVIFGALTNDSGLSAEKTLILQRTFAAKKYPVFQKTYGQLVFGKQKFMPGTVRETELFENELVAIAGSVALDNRLVIAQRLGLSDKLQAITDDELVARAYLQWGVDCVERFDGVFAFVLVDKKQERLFMASDQAGNAAVYYATCGRELYFASSAQQLTGLNAEFAEIDAVQLSRLIIEKGLYHIPESERSCTLHKNIKVVPPGYSASCSLSDPVGSLRLHKYYELEEHCNGKLKLGSDREYEQAYLECINRAVKVAMGDRRVAAEMSSGFDSTVVSCLAANELKKNGARLKAYINAPDDTDGLLPLHSHHLMDEYPLAKTVADYNGNIDLMRVGQGDGNAWTDMPVSLKMLEMPVYNFCNLGWIITLRRRAAADGAQVLLNASMGNMIISCGSYPRSVNQLLRDGRYVAVLRLFADRLMQKPEGYRSFRAALAPVARYWIPKREEQHEQSAIWRDLCGSTERFAGLERTTAAFDDYLKLFVGASVHSLKKTGIAQMAELGLIVRDPLRSRHVFEFARSIPPEQFAKKFSDRSLIRRASVGLLPDEKRLSNSRGLQGSDWLRKLERDWQKVLVAADNAAKKPLLQQLLKEDGFAKCLSDHIRLDVNDHQNGAVRDIMLAVAIDRFSENAE